jgi:hypothetical protein
MQPLTWTPNNKTAKDIGAHNLYETQTSDGTSIRIIKFGRNSQCSEVYPWTIAVSNGITGSNWFNVASPASCGGHLLQDVSLIDAKGFVQLFNSEMRELDYSYASLAQAQEAVESVSFLYAHFKEHRPNGWPHTAGSFIPEPRVY